MCNSQKRRCIKLYTLKIPHLLKKTCLKVTAKVPLGHSVYKYGSNIWALLLPVKEHRLFLSAQITKINKKNQIVILETKKKKKKMGAPENVGILAMEIYFPPTCIQQVIIPFSLCSFTCINVLVLYNCNQIHLHMQNGSALCFEISTYRGCLVIAYLNNLYAYCVF